MTRGRRAAAQKDMARKDDDARAAYRGHDAAATAARAAIPASMVTMSDEMASAAIVEYSARRYHVAQHR